MSSRHRGLAADNLRELPRTGEAKPVPENWISEIRTMTFFGEKVVFAMAGSLRDPDEITAEFQQEFGRTFGKRRAKIMASSLEIVDYLRMRLEGIAFKDIAHEWLQRHRCEFPRDQDSAGYRRRRPTLEDTLKHALRSTQSRPDALVGD